MKTCIAFSGPDLALSQTKEIKHLSKEQHQKANVKLEIFFVFNIFLHTSSKFNILFSKLRHLDHFNLFIPQIYASICTKVFSFCPPLFLVVMDLLYEYKHSFQILAIDATKSYKEALVLLRCLFISFFFMYSAMSAKLK